MVALPPGITGNAGLVLNAGQLAFLGSLRAAVPGSIPLHVTSGTRTPERQAGALVEKRRLGDDIRRLYRQNADIADALMRAPNSVSAMAAVLRSYMAQGRYLSRHMRGDAIDLRSFTLSPAQREIVMQAARRLGAKADYETTPPHIHLERVGGTSRAVVRGGRAGLRAAGGAAGALHAHRRVVYAITTVVGLALVAALWRVKTRSPPP